MHIPDGFISPAVNIGSAFLSFSLLGYGLRKLSLKLEEKTIPLFGVIAAFLFSAQMLNFPVAAGTSGHFLGAFFAGVVLGPFNGFLVISLVLAIQCLGFGDGGISVLGTNMVNMGFFAGIVPLFLFNLSLNYFKAGKKSFLVMAAFFAWFSVVFSSLMVAVELWISGVIPLKIGVVAMGSSHLLIGAGEAVITFFALSGLFNVRPDLVKLWEAYYERNK
ncbi:MAG: energy-coupling factor ABC transporter permease [Deltaproteobacteria bacterium]|jgi:cobalt/nickel transport system permease protein|nr:energy-coupling factor ABC transporter permease [Deltaproteobacteria bacterium]